MWKRDKQTKDTKNKWAKSEQKVKSKKKWVFENAAVNHFETHKN